MSDYFGQVPEEVDALAGDFEAKAGDLENLKSMISGKLAGTTWTGPDAERFQLDWIDQVQGRLVAAANKLDGIGFEDVKDFLHG